MNFPKSFEIFLTVNIDVMDTKFKSKKQLPSTSHEKEILIFLAGLNFWEGLFENVNIKFIRHLFDYRLADFSNILMSIIVPPDISDEQQHILNTRQETIQSIVTQNGATIEFCHIRGRSLKSLSGAYSQICRKTASFKKRFIWSSNYFNCFLGVLIKRRFPATHLHFDMMGLAPHEELYYSNSNVFYGLLKFYSLKILGNLNLKRADSVSVVSYRFKSYILSRHKIDPSKIDVMPCFYDDAQFNYDSQLRHRYRRQYKIKDAQTLFLYSGMLQKWQMPDMLFAFIKKIQTLDNKGTFRFMVLTFDREKAEKFAAKYQVKDLIIDSKNGHDLNGIYNAADIGIATRSNDWVSKVSSPVKIPEYLATKNSLILMESIGDYGTQLKHKKYVLVKKDKKDLLNTTIDEIHRLEKSTDTDLHDIQKDYSVHNYFPVIKKIFKSRHHQ